METKSEIPRFGDDDGLRLIQAATWEPNDDDLQRFKYDEPGVKCSLGGRSWNRPATLPRIKGSQGFGT